MKFKNKFKFQKQSFGIKIYMFVCYIWAYMAKGNYCQNELKTSSSNVH